MRRRVAFLLSLALIATATSAFSDRAHAVCTTVTNVNQLQAIRNTPTGSYCLSHDIDASSATNFKPIGDATHGLFTGTFDGKGFAIRNLTVTGAANRIGLFGTTDNAVIKNVRLENVRMIGNASNAAVGGLAGLLDGGGGSTSVSNVHVSGLVKCNAANCGAGGLFGANGGTPAISQSSTSATVTAGAYAGGLSGFTSHVSFTRVYATGPVTCMSMNCMAGGLIARMQGGSFALSFATGPITGGDGMDARTGGLIALTEIDAAISRSFAAGTVTGGDAGYATALISQHNSSGAIDQTYAVGPVRGNGATLAGLIASSGGGATITDSYWDTQTTGQATSVAGTGLTTDQLRTNLPMGFGGAWGINRMHSYPYLVDANIDFVSPLATAVQFDLPYVFLPIGQFDDWEYLTAPDHPGQASLATVYTMIARGIGNVLPETGLAGVKIDRYFWDDATRTTHWRGPVTNFATLGPLTAISGATPLDNTNVINPLNHDKPVILRGRYTTGGGMLATHWMIGTLYKKNPDGSVKTVVADDPSTGQQIEIDPVTKMVVSPADFPLTNFRVNGYRTVTLELPVSDRRLKRDIVEVAKFDNGLRLYRYRYRWSKQRYVGVMAQEVAAVRPDAVAKGPDGYLRVNYPRLGMQLQTWREWLRSSKHREPPPSKSAAAAAQPRS